MNDTEILDRVIEALKSEIYIEGEITEGERSRMIKWIKEQRRHQSLAEYVNSTILWSPEREDQAIISLRRIVREEIIGVLRQSNELKAMPKM